MTRRISALPGVLPILLPVLGALALTGCPSPDVDASLQRFLDDTQDDRDEAANVKLDTGGMLADVTGTFLFALDTIVLPGVPLQFIADVTFTPGDSGGMLGMELQPLALDMGSVTDPRTPVGDKITIDPVPVTPDGKFEIASLGTLVVTGEANPITGAEIQADVSLSGSIIGKDLFCGQVGGMVFQPLMIDLAGSTFGAQRIEATDPASLPMPVFACPEDTGGSGSGGSGGSGGSTGG